MKFIDWCYKTGNDPLKPESRILHKAAQQREASMRRKAKKEADMMLDAESSSSRWLRDLRRLWKIKENAEKYILQISQAQVLTPEDELRLDEGKAALRLAIEDYEAHAAQRPSWADEFERRAEAEALGIERQLRERTIRRCREDHARMSRQAEEKPHVLEKYKAKLKLANEKYEEAKRHYYKIKDESMHNTSNLSPLTLASREEAAFQAYEKASEDKERASRRLAKITEQVPTVAALEAVLAEQELCELRIQQIEEQQKELLEGLPEHSHITFKERRNMSSKTTRAGRPTGASSPQKQAQRWAEKLPATLLEKYAYTPETGELVGPYGTLRYSSDVVVYYDPATLKQRNVPKGLVISLLMLGQAFMLEPSTNTNDVHRWAWNKLRVKQPRNAKNILWASDLTDIAEMV